MGLKLLAIDASGSMYGVPLPVEQELRDEADIIIYFDSQNVLVDKEPEQEEEQETPCKTIQDLPDEDEFGWFLLGGSRGIRALKKFIEERKVSNEDVILMCGIDLFTPLHDVTSKKIKFICPDGTPSPEWKIKFTIDADGSLRQ